MAIQNGNISKNGFTLVELSIVLVIIGLLIGGILAARSMIQTSIINSQIRQIEQYDIIIKNFHTKFNSLPGDTGSFELGTCMGVSGVYGNGNGIIDDRASTSLYHPNNEFSNFWPHLNISGMLTDGITYSCTSGAGSTIIAGAQVPKAKMNYPASNVPLGILVYGIASEGKNYYELFSSRTNSTYGAPPSMTAKDMLALDTKMDDGKPSTGKFVARLTTTTMANTALASGAWCLNGTDYYVGSTHGNSPECLPRIEMFSSSGGS